MAQTCNFRAFILRRTPFGEADKLVTYFSDTLGKSRAVARGARRVKSSLAGRVEPLVLGHFRLIKRRSLDYITEGRILEPFWGLRQNLDFFAAGQYLAWLLDNSLADGQREPKLFRLLADCLYYLDKNCQLEGKDSWSAERLIGRTVDHFEKRLLELSGLGLGELAARTKVRDNLSDYLGLDLHHRRTNFLKAETR